MSPTSKGAVHASDQARPVWAGVLPTLAANLRSLPRAAWILFFGTFLNKFGTFVIPFLALYMTRQGYSMADAGVAISAYGIGNLIAAVLGGHLADTFGRRKTIMLSMGTGAAAMMLLFEARGLAALVLLTGVTGLAAELYRPASSALLADLVPAGQRVTAFAAYRMAFNAGWAFGPAAAGLLAAHSFFWLFVGDAATSLLFGAVAYWALPKTAPRPARAGGWCEALRVLRRDRRLHQVLGAAFAAALVFYQMISTYGLRVTGLGFSAGVYGGLISLNGLLVVLCELPLTTVTQRLPPRRVMAFGYLLVGAGFAWNGCIQTLPALAAAMVVFTLGEMCSMPVAAAYIADLASEDLRGRYLGVYTLTWSLALIFGPVLGMLVLAHRPVYLWWAGGVLGAVASAVIGVGSAPDACAASRRSQRSGRRVIRRRPVGG